MLNAAAAAVDSSAAGSSTAEKESREAPFIPKNPAIINQPGNMSGAKQGDVRWKSPQFYQQHAGGNLNVPGSSSSGFLHS